MKLYFKILNVFIISLILLIFIQFFGSQFIYITTKDGKHELDLNSIINITDKRLTYDYTYYNNDKVLGVNCLLDSSYFLSLTKIGLLKNKNVLQSIKIEKRKDSTITTWRNFNKIVTTGNVTFEQEIFLTFDRTQLPMVDSIKQITLYISVPYKQKWISSSIIEYEVLPGFNFISFNNAEKSLFYTGNKPSSIIFYMDNNKNLYVINFSAIRNKKYKSFEEIIQ